MAYLDDTGLAYFWGKIKAWCSSLFALDGDVVHKAGTETVSGQKTFSQNVKMSVDAVKGTLPSSQKWRSIFFMDSTAGDETHSFCAVSSQVDEQGVTRAYLRAYRWEAGSVDGALLAVVQPLSGDPYAVAPSTSENRSYGQDIVTRDWLSKDARLVHVGGRERVVGEKYFNQYFSVEVPLVRGTVPSEAVYSGFSFYDTSAFDGNDGDSARKFGALTNIVGSDGSSHTYMRAYKNIVGGDASAVLEIVYPASGDPYAAAPSTSTSRSAGTDIVTRDFIPNDTRIVHTTGNETIGGLKTFSSDVKLKNSAIEILNPPSSDRGSSYVIEDDSGNRIACLQYIYRTNGAYDIKMACFHQTNLAGFTAIQVGYDENDIGYAKATSTSSLRSDGTDIVTRNWIPNDTRIVHTTGNETISGSKTFTNYVLSTGFRVNDGSNNAHELVFQDSSGSNNSGIWDATFGKWVVVSDGNGDVSLYGNASTATKLATARSLKVALGSTTAVTFDGSANQNSIPVSGVLDVANGGTGSSTKNFVDLSNAQTVGGAKTFSSNVLCNAFRGTATDKKGSVSVEGGSAGTGALVTLYGCQHASYAGQFTIRARASDGALDRSLTGRPGGTLTWNGQTIQTTSDERLKTPLSAVPDAVLDAWEAAGWGEFRFLDAVEAKGDSARLHLGLIAQRVKAVFEERGLDACRYGILCYEAEEDLWMVRYTEALAMEAACQRRRAGRAEARIAALEDRLAALELRLGSE